ncbi:hypothetical protein QR721_12785 [Aciduricibacillus chroicocephali]|uniref:DUF1440 domain-containing protein n=1 Tax=Aciduricibacillus chroicocephali TaxID=3054939 RepID=A0ABY9KUF3_9BACI|nr:hypothetical protein QR721_12785 [Bacillaceae bacterium 44XB]
MSKVRKEKNSLMTMVTLIVIGLIAGSILAGLLKIVQVLSGNEAYPLLFNMDYIPLLKQWNDVTGAGYIFHYVTCIASVIFLFYLLRQFSWQYKIWPYIALFGAGGGALYFLSALTEAKPAPDDFFAWLCWTVGHFIFGYVSGRLIQFIHQFKGGDI